MSTFFFIFLVLPVEENFEHYHFAGKNEEQRKVSSSEHLILFERFPSCSLHFEFGDANFTRTPSMSVADKQKNLLDRHSTFSSKTVPISFININN